MFYLLCILYRYLSTHLVFRYYCHASTCEDARRPGRASVSRQELLCQVDFDLMDTHSTIRCSHTHTCVYIYRQICTCLLLVYTMYPESNHLSLSWNCHL